MSITEALRLGAVELKAVYNRNLFWAWGISVAFHAALIGIYILSLHLGNTGGSHSTPIARMRLTNIAPPAQNTPPPPPPVMVPPQLQTGGTGGVAARAGTPVAIPDALVAPDAKPFATETELPVSTPKGGDGTGFQNNDLGKPIDLGSKLKEVDKEKLPDPDDFVGALEEEPKYDEGELQRRVVYPEIARQNGIDGTVVVRALIDKQGHAVRTIIDRGANPALDSAAVQAVKKTPFTAAIQNKQPIAVWLQIPVVFKLQ